MRELLTDLLDALFPPDPHRKRLMSIDGDAFDRSYEPRMVEGIHVLGRYANPTLQAAIHENKFHHSHAAAALLARHLDRWIEHRPSSLIVPIPLGNGRLRSRGHNQVETILQSSSFARHIAANVLVRTRETDPQSRLTTDRRLENVKGAFAVGSLATLEGISEIIIIDDVTTSGATLKEARAALAPHLPSDVRITLLAIAH